MATNLVSKSNTVSDIWAHFGFEADDKGQPGNLDKAICRIHRTEVSVSRGNTTNLRSHLRINHTVAFAGLGSTSSRPSTSGQQRQLGVSDAFARGAKYQSGSNRWRALTDSVTRYLVEEMVPFRTVEKPAFKAMLHEFDKQYVLPDRKYFSQTAIPEKYLSVKDGVIQELKYVDYFSVIADMWSSINNMPYMSLTIHYLRANWELISKCLETVFTPESHTADNLAEALRSSYQEWSLDERKLQRTTDNGANIVAAVRKLGWTWLNCFGHNLHLALTNLMKTEKDRTARAMGVCRNLVTAFSQSWQKKKKLQKEQVEHNLPQHGLVLVSCAWGTKQKMVARILEQIPAIRRVLMDDRRSQHLIPTWQDIEVLESINAALKKVADFTAALSSEKTVTVSSVLPVLQLLTEDILLPTNEDTELTRNIKQKMIEVLKDKYSAPGSQQLLAKASFIDPRHKADINPQHDTKDALLEEMLAMPEERRDIGGGEAAMSEEALDLHSDLLAWWRDNQARFPLLSKVARKYLTVCATSTPSERVFSVAGNIVTPLRSSLKPDKVNMLVFLSRNMKTGK
uniref:HAT C-terminal dimerisation domain-containing protein n=1 Tax=Oryzias latipes TaxID=8090 RepID=A0A3P9IHA7_ORYLA